MLLPPATASSQYCRDNSEIAIATGCARRPCFSVRSGTATAYAAIRALIRQHARHRSLPQLLPLVSPAAYDACHRGRARRADTAQLSLCLPGGHVLYPADGVAKSAFAASGNRIRGAAIAIRGVQTAAVSLMLARIGCAAPGPSR